MNKVYVVQELKRFHCPECDGSYATKIVDEGVYQCKSCHHKYVEGIPKPIDTLEAAAVYGEMEVLLPMNHIGIALQPLVAMLKSKLKDFSDADFLLMAGDPVACSMSAMIAGDMNRGRVNFLRWDRQARAYIKMGVSTR